MKTAFYFLIFSLLISCSHEKILPTAARTVASTQAQTDVEGIWALQGSNSSRGPYTGEMELRRGGDGTYNVIRIVNYISYYFEGLRVQEVWTGKAVPNSEGLVISYELKDADFITELSGVKRKLERFKNKTVVNEFFHLNAKDFLESTFSDKTNATYQEWMATKRSLEANPIWVSQRSLLTADGQKALSPRINALLKSSKSQLNFDKDRMVLNRSHNSDFKAGQAYVVIDHTDFDFYQKNNDKLRIENKPIDTISLVESLLRRNAYVYTLQQKATSFEKNLQTRHINDQGLISPIKIEEAGVLKFITTEDVGFLTAMYLSAQAMRYQNTKTPEALENIKKTLPALLNYLANSEEQNSDFLIAVKHALVWMSIVLPKSETTLWEKLSEKSLQLMQSKEPENTTSVALAAYLTANSQLKDKADVLYRQQLKEARSQDAFYWKGSANWHLAFTSTIESITNIMLCDLLEMKENKEVLQKQLLDSWILHSPAQRHLLTLAAFGFSFEKGIRTEKFKNESSDEKMKSAVDAAIWGLRQMPLPKPAFDLAYDHSLSPDWALSPVPKNFWNSKKSVKAEITNSYQGLYEYPLFEDKTFDSPFVWRENAFSYRGQSSKSYENTGVDYLYAFWLAQYVGAGVEKPSDKN